ncbi:class I SAM-dependent methyltransferase [Candidatus Nitronereus thalassa]|uniref:Class I SAM-dependent methyltransferase n=1 Tax=Candidatus Nitronereus thalassa TaxID=3020898 RepID=A0ABU3K9T7_9BACT|nr:class I SAM-dependent methyltransferase [Candidatus Nitronereus thalassa]MDT7043158.1 class I SAM-dependent methyltransferase [Candidatus Nitronereus thalassa]
MSSLRLTTKRTIQAYTSGSEDYFAEWHRRTYRTPPLLTTWIHQLPKHPQLLDLGCGLGQDSRYLRQQKFHVVGLDMTWPFLQVARKRSWRLSLVQADIERLPFLPLTFHGIWAAASLIHTPKSLAPRIFQELHDMAKPGGLLGATLLHGKGSGFLGNQWIPGRFLSKWHKQELHQMMGKAGWEVVFLKTVVNQERKGRWLNVLAKRKT